MDSPEGESVARRDAVRCGAVRCGAAGGRAPRAAASDARGQMLDCLFRNASRDQKPVGDILKTRTRISEPVREALRGAAVDNGSQNIQLVRELQSLVA
ncbi:hypothetical protein RR46_10402 [Papilio xuthus]|uniref:Uncharacterized protein n=1 Tax=Papilio xuthus TaxID=66420 RepID=A0A194Q261_PAPXU|nr:hypothetical protein RR46_10402 [Papilio xuthus]